MAERCGACLHQAPYWSPQSSAGSIRKTGEIDYMDLSGVLSDRWAEARALLERDLPTTPQPWVQFVYFNCGKP
jgi:peptide/nickel transport system substrate-binding protein